jgi:hypothetical protein
VVVEDAPGGPAQGGGAAEAPGQRQPRAGPGDPHRGLAHVADDRADQDRGAGAEGAGDGAVAAVGDHQRGRRHQLAVAEPLDEDGVGRDLDRALGDDAVGRRHHPHRLIGERRQRRPNEVVLGVMGGAGGDEDEGALARRQLDLRVRHLEGHRPGHLDPGRPLARVLKLGVGGDQRQVGADAAVEALDRRQVQPLPLQVEVAATVLEADVQRPLPGPPDRRPDRRARRPQADREERLSRLDHRVDVGDQGRQRHPGALGGQGGGEGEDVADGDVRAHLLQQRQQRPRRLGGVLAVVGVRLRRREHLVFLGRGEAEPGALDRGPALLPGLDHDLVPALGQRPTQGDRWEDVPGIAEGGDQDAQGFAAALHCRAAARGYRDPRRGG